MRFYVILVKVLLHERFFKGKSFHGYRENYLAGVYIQKRRNLFIMSFNVFNNFFREKRNIAVAGKIAALGRALQGYQHGTIK
jgi:hypothetical protein